MDKNMIYAKMAKNMMYEYDRNMVISEKLKELVENTMYCLTQTNGQRIYSMHFVNRDMDTPPRGCELFIGKLPRNMFEDELVPLFAQIAPIYELRLMVDFNGRNRGYCFVRYFTRADAELAIYLLNNHEIRPGCTIGVFKSVDNTRLFVGGLPENKSRGEVWEALDYHIEDIKDVIMYPSYSETYHNRGYAFLEFRNHRAAAIARRRLPPGSLMLWGLPIKVDWAEPLPEPDPTVMAQVTTLYIRNIPATVPSDLFKKFLFDIMNPSWFTKIHKAFDYAFLHMTDRKIGEEAMRILANFSINGKTLEISWARPDSYSKRYMRNKVPQHYCMSLPAKSRWMIKRKLYVQSENHSTSSSENCSSEGKYDNTLQDDSRNNSPDSDYYLKGSESHTFYNRNSADGGNAIEDK